MTVSEFLDGAIGQITTRDRIPQCGVWLKSGEDVPGLAVIGHPDGRWSVLTLDGEVRTFTRDEVA